MYILMNKTYIAYIQQYLSISILHWNYNKGTSNVSVLKTSMKYDNIKVLYIPFIYKNKRINLRIW